MSSTICLMLRARSTGSSISYQGSREATEVSRGFRPIPVLMAESFPPAAYCPGKREALGRVCAASDRSDARQRRGALSAEPYARGGSSRAPVEVRALGLELRSDLAALRARRLLEDRRAH